MGIMSITPRIDYSQGNKWYMTELDNMNDLHKPALDGIGFQELITEQMAWWDNTYLTGNRLQSAAGKTVAWINYMTNVNRTFGNFAPGMSESFMVLNRNYSIDANKQIEDLTTYIDPVKFNYIFYDSQGCFRNSTIRFTWRIGCHTGCYKERKERTVSYQL